MSHLEYIYILNQDLTKFYKDPPPVGWNRDMLTGSESILWWWKHIFFTEDFPIYHIIHLNNLYIILCVWFREGGDLAPSIGQPPLLCVFSRDRSPVRTSSPRQPSGKDHWNQLIWLCCRKKNYWFVWPEGNWSPTEPGFSQGFFSVLSPMEFWFLDVVASGLLSWGHFISSDIIDLIAQKLFKLNWAGR